MKLSSRRVLPEATARAGRSWPILAAFAELLATQAVSATGGGLGTLMPFQSCVGLCFRRGTTAGVAPVELESGPEEGASRKLDRPK
jgi:hypothetical protein